MKLLLLHKRITGIFIGICSLIIILWNFNYIKPSFPDDDMRQEDIPSLASTLNALGSSRKEIYVVSSSTPQFILLSFDGSKSLSMLNETLDFQRKMSDENKPLHFTYFINAAYFLTVDNASLYQGPRQKAGVSNIGFSHTTQDIADRVYAFNTALAQGNEVGSHAVGHFNGAKWSYNEWKQEFTSFNTILSNVQKNNSTILINQPQFTPENIIGFRAPNLAENEHLYEVLQDFHFSYDTSGIGPMENWPQKDRYGIWHIPVGSISIGSRHQPVVSIDYSLWMHQSRGKKTAVRGSLLWNEDYNDVLAAYMNYFNSNYNGNRAPIVIVDHFSKWNNGVYWEAMKTFAQNVCGRPFVHCVTFRQLVDYLNTVGAPRRVGI